jgi:biopolymer transport protein ExbB/TolQ
MRSLPQSALVAFALTAILFVVLKLLLPADIWFTVFLFERSPTQWLAIAMFVFGLDQVIARLRVARQETDKLARVKWPDLAGSPAPAPAAAPTAGWVEPRLAQLSEVARHHSAAFTSNAAKELAEEDQRRFGENYVLTTDVVQLLPLVGFFGTVWGLSQGLYNNFVLQGEDSTSSFANAIGTAFDTTLLALFLTIVLSILQSVIRRSEQGVLERLDAVVASGLGQLELSGGKVVPRSDDPRIWWHELGLDPAELIGFFRDKLGTIAGQLQDGATTNDRMLAALQQLDATLAATRDAASPAPDLTPQLTATVEALQALREVQQETATAQRRVVELQKESNDGQAQSLQLQQETAAVLGRLDELLAEQIPPALAALGRVDEGVRDQASDAAAHARQLLEQIAALQEQLTTHQAESRARDSRPKSFVVTETPPADDAGKA